MKRIPFLLFLMLLPLIAFSQTTTPQAVTLTDYLGLEFGMNRQEVLTKLTSKLENKQINTNNQSSDIYLSKVEYANVIFDSSVIRLDAGEVFSVLCRKMYKNSFDAATAFSDVDNYMSDLYGSATLPKDGSSYPAIWYDEKTDCSVILTFTVNKGNIELSLIMQDNKRNAEHTESNKVKP